jgi:hypothetical protein
MFAVEEMYVGIVVASALEIWQINHGMRMWTGLK